MTPGELIKERRVRHGLSQRRLAHRAGTSQSAIARIESGSEDVSWARLRRLLIAMGEQPVLQSTPLPGRYDARDVLEQRSRPPADRLASGIACNELCAELDAAGRAAHDAENRSENLARKSREST